MWVLSTEPTTSMNSKPPDWTCCQPPLRQLVGFASGRDVAGSVVIAVDSRLHGVPLHSVVLQMLGLSFQLWHVHALHSTAGSAE